MKLKSLEISKSNYREDGSYEAEQFYKGAAIFDIRGNLLTVNLPPETIQSIVEAITSTTLVACEIVGEISYRSVENSLRANVLEHKETTDNA